MNRIITCDVVHYLGVSSARDVEELVDVGAHSVTFLGSHVEASLQVGGVVIDHCLDLLQDHVKPEMTETSEVIGAQEAARNHKDSF